LFIFAFPLKKYVNGFSDRKEVAKAINAEIWVLGTFSGWLLMKALKISKLNKFYDGNKHLKT
jgi:hypothetical protein